MEFYLISGYDQTKNMLPIYKTEFFLVIWKKIQLRVLKGLKRLTVPLL